MGAKVALKAVLLASLVLVCRRGEGLVQFFIRHGLDSKPGLLFCLPPSVRSLQCFGSFNEPPRQSLVRFRVTLLVPLVKEKEKSTKGKVYNGSVCHRTSNTW